MHVDALSMFPIDSGKWKHAKCYLPISMGYDDDGNENAMLGICEFRAYIRTSLTIHKGRMHSCVIFMGITYQTVFPSSEPFDPFIGDHCQSTWPLPVPSSSIDEMRSRANYQFSYIFFSFLNPTERNGTLFIL